ncbi:MAG: hypothetical protein JO001_04495 [Alphaproteobacteria bacterium]|nr:hypothetical protein [Alphaproteobacteria bacterium]
MSRLDSFIRRLEAQRACLNSAVARIRDIPGYILELGLGNGRTFDHLRELLPDRDIYVCERRVAAHPDCVPPPDRLILGDMRETLASAGEWLEGRVALMHFDVGTGDAAGNVVLAAELTPLIVPLLCEGAILVSDPEISSALLKPMDLPQGVAPGRYRMYRRQNVTA